MLSQQIETKSRLLAKLLRELLALDLYDSLADLTAALKVRCSRLRIRYTPTDVASALYLVGSNHALVDVAPQEQQAPPTGRPLTALESSRLYRVIAERYAADNPLPEILIAPEVDTDVARRLSALDESAALTFFWNSNAAFVNRRELLLLFEAVTIARPATWSPRAIRSAFDAHARAWRADYAAGCFACSNRDELTLHHLITIDHGGSNSLRNIVPLCFECHHYLHPWLKAPVKGFASLGQIAKREG